MWQNFLIALEITWKGMGGIFAACGIIMLAVMLMGKAGGKHSEKKKGENGQAQ